MNDHLNWHALTKEEVLRLLETDPERGLTSEEAKKRLEKYGPNELTEKKKISPVKLFLRQFTSVLMLILIAAVIISAALGETLDALIILVIVLACGILGFIQEFRAEKAMAALKKMAALTALVIRDGKETRVPVAELVPGDNIFLNTGDKVPADCRLLEGLNLKAEEAALTGESVPTEKDAGVVLKEDAPPGDRKNMCFSATIITYGHGKAVVTATGMQTEFGKIAGLLQEVEAPPTPLEQRLAVVGKWLGILCLAIVAVVTLIEVVFRHEPVLDMFIWAVSLAVAAVPEALPAVVTGALAIGVQRMAKSMAIIRRLPAVETLGCTTVICSDKTGTLTRNEMTVREVYADGKLFEISGTGYEPKGEFRHQNRPVDPSGEAALALLGKIIAVNNDAYLTREKAGWTIVGDPTEGALVAAAAKAGLDVGRLRQELPRIGEIPFDSERKCMTTIHRAGEQKLAFVKGAPEVILRKCSAIWTDHQEVDFSAEEKEAVLKINEDMAKRALRVLAAGYRFLPPEIEEYNAEEIEKELVFVGLIGMIDPPREEAKQAIQSCREAGIKAVMVTGDHHLTATAIGIELGLFAQEALTPEKAKQFTLTGSELDRLTQEELVARVEDTAVYARVSPEHKMRIVDAWQARRHVVAMTGDGVNDAPALKKADIGVAMGITGTDVTKEAADMTLLDDNFATIVKAVEEGRGIYDNIKKYLVYLLSCNITEVLVCFFSALFNWMIPLAPIHLLWINLITDGLPALALGVDPADPGIMKRPPRDPKESIFTRRVVSIMLLMGIWMTLILLPVFYWYWKTGGPGGLTEAYVSAAPLGYRPEEFLILKAQTITVALLVIFELFNCYNCRHEIQSLFKIGWFGNKWLNLAVLSSLALTLAVMYIPGVSKAFHLVPLSLVDWAVTIILGFTLVIFVETVKFAIRLTSQPKRAVQ
ncbi:MAG: cation-translocating P-type ATPase [Bacillota bacterium]